MYGIASYMFMLTIINIYIVSLVSTGLKEKLGGGGGVTSYISEYGDVRALHVYFSTLPIYEKLCFSASNYMNSHSFHSSHYFNSPLNLQFRH